MQQVDIWEWIKRVAAIAAIAALIVVLVNVGFDSIATRIAATEDRLTTRIAATEDRITAQVDSMETKLDSYIVRADERIALIEQEQARLDGVMTGYIEAKGAE